MKTKDVTKLLGINRERLKYYKRERLLSSEDFIDGDMSDYSEKGVNHVKRLEVMTKYGLTAGYIRKIESGEMTFDEALCNRVYDLNKQMEKERKCITLIEELRSGNVEYENFPTDYYWDEIQRREQQGEEFMDIDDYDFKREWFNQHIKCPCCGAEQEVDLEDYLYDETCNEERSDNGMGPDIVYDFDSDDVYECCSCGKIIRITGWLREYPIGAYDSDEIKAELYQPEA